jgi:hypothetical protein
MTSFKINIGLVDRAPSLMVAKVALDQLGRPSDKEYGVQVVHDIVEGRLQFTSYTTQTIKVPQIQTTDGGLETKQLPKTQLFDAMLREFSSVDKLGVLEVFTGSVKSLDKVAELLAALEFADDAPSVRFIPIDIYATVLKLRDHPETKNLTLVSAKVNSYVDANDNQIKGGFTVKFPKDLAPDNAMAFIAEHQKNLATVRVKYSGQQLSKPITLTIRPSAFFTFTANDADETKAKNICRRLAGALAKATGEVATPVADTFANQVADAMGDMLIGDAHESPAAAAADGEQVDLSSPAPAPTSAPEDAAPASDSNDNRPDPVGEMADVAAAETDQSSAAA